MPDLDHRQPICASHDPPVNMHPLRNGVIVRLTQDRLIVGDLWECPTCEARVFDRLGWGRMVERWEPEFAHLEARLNSVGENVVAGYDGNPVEVYGYADRPDDSRPAEANGGHAIDWEQIRGILKTRGDELRAEGIELKALERLMGNAE